MVYHHLLQNKPVVNAAVIGAGHFGTAVVTQQSSQKGLLVPMVADKNTDAAKSAFVKAGIPEDKIVFCNNAAAAQLEIERGNYVYTNDAEIIMDVPAINIVCEGTGIPEIGAHYCMLAIEKGKHIALVSKELDSVIGPLLKEKACAKGLVCTPIDGDQHGLLMQMVEWARLIGLTVISGGKARDGEFILDETKRTVSVEADGVTIHRDYCVTIPEEGMKYFEKIPQGRGMAAEYIAKRMEYLRDMPHAGMFDLCELTIMANATGLAPSIPETTQAPLRITELPIAYCAENNNGVYKHEGIIDVTTNLRRYDEAGMGGGVFLVVRCDNAYSNYILTTKGQIPNYDSSTAVIYRPYHLCGVEVATSLQCAVNLGIDTGSVEYKQQFDLIRVAKVDIPAGETLGGDHDERMFARIVPATAMKPENPIPAHMATGNALVRTIKAGEVITYSMVQRPENSLLWALRKEMNIL